MSLFPRWVLTMLAFLGSKQQGGVCTVIDRRDVNIMTPLKKKDLMNGNAKSEC